MSFAAADGASVSLGYQFLPHLPAGLSLSLFETFGQLGIEGSLNAGGEENEAETTRSFSISLGTNLATPVGLYPSLAISAENLRRSRADDLVENRTVWGLDTKLTAVRSWAGITVGYRAPFRAPLGGSVILGVSLVLRPY